MNKAEIIALAQSLAIQALPADALSVFFDEVVEDVGKRRSPPLTGSELFAITASQPTYAFAASAVRLLAVFTHGTQLSAALVTDLEAYSATWRTDLAVALQQPFAYTTEQVAARYFTLCPQPGDSSSPFIFTHGAPYGEDFPANAGVQVFSQKREDDLPDWIALHIAVNVLEREYARPSAHQDTAYAEVCKRVADLLYRLGGMS